jgi:hypothetical protein
VTDDEAAGDPGRATDRDVDDDGTSADGGEADADDPDRDRDPVERNVLGEPLAPCGRDPTTGFARDGYCRDRADDPGRHELCAVVTDEFLTYSRERGNDLVTPRPEFDFPGLEPGDRWCVCVPRWLEALEAGVAPPVVLAATNEAVLDSVSAATLREHAHDGGTGASADD